MYKLLKIFYKILKTRSNKLKLPKNDSFDISLIYTEGVSIEDKEVITAAFALLDRDHQISEHGIINTKNQKLLNFEHSDLIIVIGCSSKIPRPFLKYFKTFKIPLVFLSTNAETEVNFKMNLFDLVFYRDFKTSGLLDKNLPVAHGLPCSNLKDLFYNAQYLYSQFRLGLILIIKNPTKESNRILSRSNLKVGFNSFHNGNFQVRGEVHAEIGSYCSFGKNLSLYTVNHDTRFASTQGYLYREMFNSVHPGVVNDNYSKSRSKGPIIINNDVWIGDDVKILSGVHISSGACIAAGSVVTKNVSSYSIMAGIPAKKIGDRFNVRIKKQLEVIEWWDWSDSQIKRNEAFFLADFTKVDDIQYLIK